MTDVTCMPRVGCSSPQYRNACSSRSRPWRSCPSMRTEASKEKPPSCCHAPMSYHHPLNAPDPLSQLTLVDWLKAMSAEVAPHKVFDYARKLDAFPTWLVDGGQSELIFGLPSTAPAKYQ
jgi:hypothetical protein